MPTAVERKALSEALERLNENMRTMSELSVLAIRKAVQALEKGRSREADEVFTLDEEIYGLKQKIEHSCIELIALYAPVASDLRTVTASLEITTDLDRIGRYSKDIAEAAEKLRGMSRESLGKIGNLTRMADMTIQMIETSVHAFAQRQLDPVRDIVRTDDAIDALHDEVFTELVEKMTDQSVSPRVGAQYILINRYFERLADHAVNIGLDVIYMITAQRPIKVKRQNGDSRPAPAPAAPVP
ncbi:MAG: phosphate signaling complex protein PhoU [Thermoplasmata archaeon]|nr:phosphate signaling complex protein PhoU [Thermoplasmata archaeon]